MTALLALRAEQSRRWRDEGDQRHSDRSVGRGHDALEGVQEWRTLIVRLMSAALQLEFNWRVARSPCLCQASQFTLV